MDHISSNNFGNSNGCDDVRYFLETLKIASTYRFLNVSDLHCPSPMLSIL